MDFEGKQQSLLTFRVGPVLCCAPSLPVRSIVTPPKLTHIPGSESSQPGIFKHGSHIVKVLDLRTKFGIDEAEQTQPGNFIITIFEKESFAFWVDQILDVSDFPSEGWGNLPAAIPRGVFTRTLLLNKKIHLYSEFEKLATIQDLGYLKHYIQQLQEQSEKKAEPKKVDAPSTLESSNKISEHNESTTGALSSENKTIEQPNPKLSTQTPDTSSKQTPIRKSLPNSYANNKIDKTNNTVEGRINSQSITQQKPKLETSPLKKTAQPTTQSAVQSTAQSKIVKSTYTPPTQNINTSAIKTTAPVASTLKTQHKIETNKPTIHTSQTSVEQANNEESSSIGIIIFFLFILGLLGAGLYFLLPEEVSTTSKYEKYGGYEKQRIEDHAELILQPMPQEPDEVPEIIIETKSVEEELVSDISTEEKLRDESLANNITREETITPESVTEDKSKSDLKEAHSYRADISKQDDEITITLHQPMSSIETTIEKEPIIEQKIEPEIKEETTIEATPVEQLKVEKLSPPIASEKVINEVLHIVVKGDTLWAIAKKYVNNPFLYPELARLSNIKNPHRIYPGNRVRIRFVKK